MKNKSKLILIAIIIALFCSLSGTLAYFSSSTDLVSLFNTKDYVFKLNAKGGKFTGGDVVVQKGQTNLPTPTRRGYTFLGYSSSSNGNTNYSTNINNITEIDNKEIYATWQVITYNISYNLNGGSISGQKATYNVEESFTLPTPTKTGYSFAGWTGSNGNAKQQSVTIPKGTINNLNYTANWNINSYQVDINPIINGTAYNSGLSGFTFDIWVNGTLVADNVIDWCQNLNYGTKVRIVANKVNGYNIIKDSDTTITVGTSNVNLNPTWLDNIGPTITGYSKTAVSWYGYNSSKGFNTYNYNINASASDVSGIARICYSLWSVNSNSWLESVCYGGSSNTEQYVNVIEGIRKTRITAYDNRGNATIFDFSYNVP